MKCIFRVSSFNVCLCFEVYFLRCNSEMHFLRNQFSCEPMFRNVFFDGGILNCIFWVSNINVHLCMEVYFFERAILKCIFWGSNSFRIYGCWLMWLVADLLDSFILSKRFKLRTELEKNINIFLLKFTRYRLGWEAPGDQWRGTVPCKSHRCCRVRGR